jgi:peptide/nickel transport system substrate-binding protein
MTHSAWHLVTRRIAMGLVALAASLGPAAAQGTSPTTLRIAPGTDVANFDPIASSNRAGSNFGYMVFDTLFALDANYVAQPQMAEGYTLSDDKLSYTITLREGLLWHDGEPVTAEDCVASIRRWGAKDGLGQLLLRQTAAMEVLDARRFVIRLKQPFGLVIDGLARTSNTAAFMMPRRLAETDPWKPVPEAIGSGPFRLERSEWVPGSRIVFSKNMAYRPRPEPASGLAGGKVAHFDRVEWMIMPDPTTALGALQRGEISLWENVPPDLIPALRNSRGLATAVVNPLGRQLVMRPNHVQPPFDNPKAREALLHLVNQEDFLAASFGDPAYYRTCVAMFFCGTPLESTIGGAALLKPDPARAAALFREAGWDFAKPITILQATDNAQMNASALVTADAMRRIGLNPQLAAQDWPSIQSRRNNRNTPDQGGWNIFFTTAPPSTSGNPVTNPLTLANCDKAFSGWPCDEALEKLRADFAEATTDAERKAIAEAFQQRAYQVGLFVPLGQFRESIGYRTELTGLVETSDVNVYWNIARKPR